MNYPREDTEDDRRLRIYHLPERRLIDVLRGDVRFIDLPQGLRVLRCFSDQHTMGIGVILQHESFDVVPAGEMIPHMNPLRLEVIDRETGPKVNFREFL
jgi:hypothetical protein